MKVDELREARSSITTLFMEFNNIKAKSPNGLIIFVEGKDSPYYYSKIRTVCTYDMNPIICKGKSMVKKTFLSLNERGVLKNIKTLFLIDRDFDENNEEYVMQNFYVTKRYAIENYYVTEKTLKLIVKYELGISEASPDFDCIMDRYRLFQNSYHRSTSLFNAWYHAIKNSTAECNVNLDDKIPDGYLSYDFKKWTVKSNYTLEKLNAKYADKSHMVEPAEISHSQQLLDSNPSFNYRGKFELTCLIVFMQNIQNELNRRKSIPGELAHNPYKAQISSNQVLSMWAQYSEYDDELIEYIKRRTTDC